MNKSTSDIIDFDFGFSFIDDEIEAVKETAVATKAAADDLEGQLSDLTNEKIALEASCFNQLFLSLTTYANHQRRVQSSGLIV